MKVYMLTHKSWPTINEFLDMVVIARDEKEARQVAQTQAEKSDDYRSGNQKHIYWTDDTKADCVEVPLDKPQFLTGDWIIE